MLHFTGIPEPQLSNELKFPRLLLCLTADFWGLVGILYVDMTRLKTIYFILLAIYGSIVLCSCEKKNYKVEIQDGSIHVTMHSPSMGIVGINQVSYDGFTYEEVEQEVFDKIRNSSYDGSYTVSVTLQFIDSYGNYYDGERIIVSNLDAKEVKKYASYYYFRDHTHISDAFPWNRKCTHCNNGYIQKERKITNKTICDNCQGQRKLRNGVRQGLFGDEIEEWINCFYCDGKGYIEKEVLETYDETCNYCGGTGIKRYP